MDASAALIADLARRGWRVAVAESLTGGLLIAELTSVPGASAVVSGGVVAYDAEVKSSVLGVDAELLERVGPVDAEVARQLAEGARHALAVGGSAADVGIATTGVAGPDPHGGFDPGTVWLGASIRGELHATLLNLSGTRDEIRAQTVARAIRWVNELLGV